MNITALSGDLESARSDIDRKCPISCWHNEDEGDDDDVAVSDQHY